MTHARIACLSSRLPFILIDGIFSTLWHFLNTQEKKSQINLSKYEGRFTSRWGETDVIEINGSLCMFFPLAHDPTDGLSPLKLAGKDMFQITGGNDFDGIGEILKYELDKTDKIRAVYWGSDPMKVFQ